MSTLYLTDEEYLLVLRRVRKRIAESKEEVSGYDDTMMGSKNTECNAGLCQDNPKVYTRSLNLWPKQYPRRVSPKYTRGQQYCPLSKEHKTDGCFYGCLYFRHHLIDRKEILRLYDERIIVVETGSKEGINV